MKFRLPNKFTHQFPVIMRKCLYVPILDQKTGKQSFVRKPTQNRYPRFHLYIEESSQEVVFDMHIDQAKTRYTGQTAHNADYESEEVKNELLRIYQVVSQFLIK